ncbi:MAG TPA: TerB N-terminal domain-containing protein [Trichocoleus sp.]|jgi:uncharacterized tellurite resistance protein B-like protein
MKFRPFWELLDELGIALPASNRIKKQQRSPASSSPPRIMSIGSGSVPDPEELLYLLEELLEAEQFELDEEPEAEDEFWVPPGQKVKVGDYTIPGGMVYVGEYLPSIGRHGVDPCLIRPSLRAKGKSPDCEKIPNLYSMSYSQMQPGDRAAYLKWLSEGRSAPKAYISYIWMFFYGLERRVLHDLRKADLQTDRAKQQELEQIVAEVKRLKKLYGDPALNWAFVNKVEAFLEICELLRSPEIKEQAIDPFKAKPFTLQMRLGQMVQQKQPIPADWALAWFTRLANNALPTSATRCLEEFKSLFRLRYQQEYGEGMRVRSGQSKLKASYYPSNPSFGRSIEITVGDLPDVTRLTAKVKKLGELVQKCRLELDTLSRFIARYPRGRNTLAAVALLPPDLLELHGGTTLKKLKTWLNKQFEQAKAGVVVVSGKELIKLWSDSNLEKLTKSEAGSLSGLLAQIGYGMEPDPRLGGTLPTVKNKIALFKMPSNHPSIPSAAYVQATLIGYWAIGITRAEDAPSPIEQNYLQTHLPEFVAVPEAERSRLIAHLHWLIQEKPTLRNLKARIEPIEPEQRSAIARFLVQVAAADGQPKPKEVQLLEKIYQQLELDPQTLYSDIHDHSTTASEPVTVRAAAPTKGHKIPAKSAQKKQEGLTLDMTLVQSKLEESKEISSLLADIFVDESVAGHPASETKPKRSRKKKATAPTRTIAGLDGAHSELLLAVAKQAVWQREELVPIATQYGLMLDGALEVINEAAFDRCDEAVIEGDNLLEVNQDVLRELMA